MKKFLSILALVMSLVMCVSMFAACGDKDGADTTAASTQDDANKVTVTWYNGTKELKTEKVEKGSKVTSWTPEAGEGETFDGWFAEASKTTAFDFEKALTEDTDIFAKFSSNVYVEDKNAYYAIGGGAGSLKDVSWDHAKGAEKTPFVKADDKTANIYTLTMTLYAGDMFQICYGSWDGQAGIGYMQGAEYCDGVNSYDKTEYKAEDKKVAQVKDADGKVVFVGSDEYNKGFEVWNITLAEGMDGEYKFTYTTYPNAKDKNLLTWELVNKLEPQAETHKMHLVGTFNEWKAEDASEEYKMAASQDGKTWTAFLTITEKTEFKVVNQIASSWHSPDGNNIILEDAGTYAVKYTVEGDVVEVAKCDYYVVGTFADAEGKAVNFAVKEGVTPKLTVDGTTASVKFEAKDVTAMSDYSWMKDQKKPGVCAIKVVLGSELGIKDWFDDKANNGDNFYLTAGEHTVTLDITAGTVTVK